MGMPAWFYRWYFRAHSLKSLKRNILRSCGLKPVRSCVVGTVETMSQAARGGWLLKVQTGNTCALAVAQIRTFARHKP